MEFIVILAAIGVLLFWAVAIYNKLVALKNRFQNAFAQIEVQLKRRYDLIPNLVETVKAYMSHERETLEAVTAARNTALAGLQAAAKDPGNAGAIQALAGAEGALGSAMMRLNAVMEAYPDLKANQNFLELQRQLAEIEQAIEFARRYYNGSVRNLNILVQSFPSNLVARAFNFATAQFFEIEDAGERAVPQVRF